MKALTKIRPQGQKVKKATSNTYKKVKIVSQKKYVSKPLNPLTISKQFKTQQQFGNLTTELMFDQQNLENNLSGNVNSFVKIAKESKSSKKIISTVEEEIVRGISESTGKSLEEISKEIKEFKNQFQKKIQETAPELTLATTEKLAETTVDTIQNYQRLKDIIEEKIQLRVDIATQSIFNVLKKPILPQPTIIEGSPPFEIATIPEVAFEKTLELMNNPEGRTKEADVPFEIDQTVQDIITQESKKNNVFESDITLGAILETLAGNESPESSAIINNKGFVDTSLCAESIKKLEEIIGQKAKELFAKDSEFIDITPETNNLNSIIKTNENGDAIIIADGLKPIEELPAEFNKLKQEIVEIETKKAFEELPSLETFFENALSKSKSQDPVLEELTKEINDQIDGHLSALEESIEQDKAPEALEKKPQSISKVISEKGKQQTTLPEKKAGEKISEPTEKKLSVPEKPEEKAVESQKQPSKIISNKEVISSTTEPQPQQKTTEPETKNLPKPEESIKQGKAPQKKEALITTTEPLPQKTIVPEQQKSRLAETIGKKQAEIQETKPIEGTQKITVTPTKLIAPPETMPLISAGKQPILISPGQKPLQTQTETIPPALIEKITTTPQFITSETKLEPLISTEKTKSQVSGPITSPAQLISTPEIKLPQPEFMQQKQPEVARQPEGTKNNVVEVTEKKVSAIDAPIESFEIQSSEVIKNAENMGELYREIGLRDIEKIDSQAKEVVNKVLNEITESTKTALQGAQNKLKDSLRGTKNETSIAQIKKDITDARVATKRQLAENDQQTKAKLNKIENPAVRQLAKDAVALMTRAAGQSLDWMERLAKILAELTNLNNGNFSNAKDIVERLEVLKKEFKQKIEQEEREANILAEMRNEKENQREQQGQRRAKSKTKETEQEQIEAKKRLDVSNAILKVISGIIAAIAIDEFDAKEIGQLAEQIANAEELIEKTEQQPITVQESDQKKSEKENTKKRFLPLINQSTKNRNRAIRMGFETPAALKKPVSVVYEMPEKIEKETQTTTREPNEAQKIDIPLTAASKNLDFHYQQDSALLGEQLHQIEQKVERQLERKRERVKTEKEEIGKEKTISDYKAAYDAADAQQRAGQPQPMTTQQEEPSSATMTPTQPSSYMPAANYHQPSFDHSFDMFDFSGLPTDFESFDFGYFGDLDFLSEFGLGDWESGEYFLGSSKEATVEGQKTGENRQEEELPQGEIIHPETLLEKKEREERWATYKMNSSDKKIAAEVELQEEEVEQKQVIRTPYKQYLIPALAIITIGCAALFYWFM